jgi:hypothetical protein
VGIIDALDELDRGRSWYLVASKSLIRYFVKGLTGGDFALKLHVGFGGGIYDQELFAGAELFPGAHLSAMAEYADGDVNLGGRFHAHHLNASLGLLDFRRIGGGISYTTSFR